MHHTWSLESASLTICHAFIQQQPRSKVVINNACEVNSWYLWLCSLMNDMFFWEWNFVETKMRRFHKRVNILGHGNERKEIFLFLGPRVKIIRKMWIEKDATDKGGRHYQLQLQLPPERRGGWQAACIYYK